MGRTERLTAGLVALAGQPLPADVAEVAHRSLLNVLGTGVGASRHPHVDQVVSVACDVGGVGTTRVPGRTELLDPWWAAIATGLAAHLDDYDDTHLATVVHPGAATLAAARSAASLAGGITGAAFLTAFALGCEAQLRVGVAMTPWHYDAGWHITGTVGVLGAATAAGLLLGLDADGLATALGVAASETLGTREGFGSAVKPFHPGKAAANGLLAARLAAEGFTSPTDVLDAPRGYFDVLSPKHDTDRALADLGARWELTDNTFKPYPCGIVSHPALDAAVMLARQVDAAAIDEVVVHCHPLVVELTGNPTPTTGLEARFSTIHGVAAGLLDGTVGLPQYAEARVTAADATALRMRIRLAAADAIAPDEARIAVTQTDGTRHEQQVAHARGSLARPLTDADLTAKVEALVEPILPGRTDAILAAARDLVRAPDLTALNRALTPGEDT